MTNPGIAAPLSRSRHNQVMEDAGAARGRATDALDLIDQALAELAPSSARVRSLRPRTTKRTRRPALSARAAD